MIAPLDAMLMYPSAVSNTPVGDARGVVVPGLGRHLAGHRPARRLEIEHGDLRFQQRGVHPAALAGLLALEQGDEDADGCVESARQIRDGHSDPHRSLTGKSGDPHETSHPLRDLIESGAHAIRTLLPEPGDARVDDSRVHGPARGVVDPEARLHVGTIVLHHHVGLLDESHECRTSFRVLEVQGHRPLVAVQVLEVRPVPCAAHAAGLVDRFRCLDLDDVGAPVRELAHGGRSGTHTGEIEHREACERHGWSSHGFAIGSCRPRGESGEMPSPGAIIARPMARVTPARRACAAFVPDGLRTDREQKSYMSRERVPVPDPPDGWMIGSTGPM